jgi:hypothetical protein
VSTAKKRTRWIHAARSPAGLLRGRRRPRPLHPQYPAPVGGPGEVPEAIARLFDKDAGCPVELVQVSEAQADEYRKAVDNHRRKGR